MAINTEAINRKLQAIQNKDLDAIIAQNVYIPTLGTNYDKVTLQAWLQKRIDFLQGALTMSDVNLTTAKDNLVNSLTPLQKLRVLKILANQQDDDIDDSNPQLFEKMCLIRLYRFITNG